MSTSQRAVMLCGWGVQPLLRYDDFSISKKMAAVRHLEFVLRMFGQSMKSICWSLSFCKILLESVQ